MGIDFFGIPILITNFNRLGCFQKQIEWLLKAGYYNIHVNDNCSTYEPLLEYYEHLKTLGVTVHIHTSNHGHNGFIHYPLYEQFKSSYFVNTDPDVVPTDKAPKNLIEILFHVMQKHNKVKCGVALKIDDLPDHNPRKQEYIDWESVFWQNQIDDNCYLADIDTTFALNAPNTSGTHNSGIRVAGDCACQHTTWYLDPNNLPPDEAYYISVLDKAHSYWSSKI
jgi:hypothetical protein